MRTIPMISPSNCIACASFKGVTIDPVPPYAGGKKLAIIDVMPKVEDTRGCYRIANGLSRMQLNPREDIMHDLVEKLGIPNNELYLSFMQKCRSPGYKARPFKMCVNTWLLDELQLPIRKWIILSQGDHKRTLKKMMPWKVVYTKPIHTNIQLEYYRIGDITKAIVWAKNQSFMVACYYRDSWIKRIANALSLKIEEDHTKIP